MRRFQLWFAVTVTGICLHGAQVLALPNPLEGDSRVFKVFPVFTQTLIAKGIPKDDRGLIGHNAQWGGFFSPRFQMGAGRSLRFSLAAGRPAEAARAFIAIESATKNIDRQGYVVSRLPPTLQGGRAPKELDAASAAAFFLSDACPAILALENSPAANDVAIFRRRAEVMEALRRALNWLMMQRDVLKGADAHAPDRLMHDAVAFYACGELSAHTGAKDAGIEFMQASMRHMHRDGYFEEDGGWDTGHQAEALRAGNDLIGVGLAHPLLRVQLYRGADWLVKRVDTQGRLDSSGNKSTCGGALTWYGAPKRVNLDDVLLTFAYTAVREHDELMEEAANRIIAGSKKKTKNGNPCFP